MQMVCLDFEGVLAPEIWSAVAKITGIAELGRTTRDIPNYDALMADRIDFLAINGIRIDRLHEIVCDLVPFEGARSFLDELRREFQVVLLSDTFYELADPLFEQLGRPSVFCHHLDVAENGNVRGWCKRLPDHKRKAIEAFQELGFHVVAAGDSYNDLAMLDAADEGILFRAPEKIRAERRDLPVIDDYGELLSQLRTTARSRSIRT